MRVPPEPLRAYRNDGDTDAAIVMVSIKMTDPRGQTGFHEGFWSD